MLYNIISSNYITNDINILHVLNDYEKAKIKLHDCYKEYFNKKEYIIYVLSDKEINIYKRITYLGYFNSKYLYLNIKIINCNNEINI